MKKKVGILILALFITFSKFTLYTVTSMEHKSRILYINSYNSSFPVFFQQIDGIKSVLTKENYIIDLEFMDSKRFFRDENIKIFYELLKYKINKIPNKYDAIIVSDDNAYDFVIKHQNELFKDIPIVFFGVNDINKAIKSKENAWVTGVAEAVSVEDTLKVAIKINPNATKIVAISDTTETGIQDVKSFYNEEKNFSDYKFSDINLGKMTTEDFISALKIIDKDTIVVFIAAFRDIYEKPIDFESGVSLVRDNCKEPLFDLYLHGIGSGILGGRVVSHLEQSKIAGEMVKKILSGTEIANIPLIEKSPNKYIFDNEQLKKYNIDKELLPVDSIILNSEITFYQSYKEYVWSIIIIFIIMIVFISYLLLNIKFRKKAERDLVDANMTLASTYEELEASSEELKAQFDEIQTQDKALMHVKESYRLICEASTGGTWDIDLKENVRSFTESWYSKYGLSKINIYNIKEWAEFIHPEDKHIFLNYQKSIKKSGNEKYSCEYRILTESGNYRYFIEQCIVLRDEKGAIERIAGSHTDITSRRLQKIKIERLAYYDNLTGLPNRTYLDKTLNSILISLEEKTSNGVVIFIGLDNFSLINDFFGHANGDKVLIYIGNRLKYAFSQYTNVFVSKFSGDEYVIVIDDLRSSEEIKDYIKRILDVFEAKFVMDSNEIYITISMGVVEFPQNGTSVEELIKNADTALHKAKDAGKNCYKFFDYSMNDSVKNKILLQSSIRNAIDNNEFVLYYQPQIDVLTGNLVGYEALIRWLSPKHGFVSPDRFIKLSEENGTIIHLGRWVLKEACKFSKKINNNAKNPYVISVNVSSIELMQYSFVDKAIDIINNSGADPNLIEIEITETALIESFDLNIEKLYKLKDFGLSIAIDDFGTGYSSLNYLNQLPIDTLKIDKSFVDDIANSNADKSFVDIMILLGHRMGLSVVAEGVETEAQLAVLVAQGCDKIQGYIYSKPMTEDDAIEYGKSFKANNLIFN